MYPKDFVVNITTLTTAVAQKGFGTILIVDHETEHPYTLYNDIASVAEDFLVTDKAYLIAQAIFGQGAAQVAITGTVSRYRSGHCNRIKHSIRKWILWCNVY